MRKFSKDGFRTGMRVLLQNGSYKFVIISCDGIYFTDNNGCYVNGRDLDSELLEKDGEKEFGIMKVFDIPSSENEYFNLNSRGCLIWERKVIKEMTVQQISDELGYEVKVIK